MDVGHLMGPLRQTCHAIGAVGAYRVAGLRIEALVPPAADRRDARPVETHGCGMSREDISPERWFM